MSGNQPPAPEAAQAASKAKAAADKAKKALGNLKNSGVWGGMGELIEDLLHRDRPTRKMARYFVFSIVGIVAVLGIGAVYFTDLRKHLGEGISDTGEQGKNLGEFLKRRADEAKRKYSTQSLGSFTIELKPPKTEGEPARRAPGVMNLAELEIIVECDEKETCELIEDRMPAVRNELTSLFTAMEREELLSREGKRRLRQRILGKLNLWLPQGKIENIYFNKLVIS